MPETELNRRSNQLQERLEALPKDLILEWRTHPATELLVDTLALEKELLKEYWAEGMYTGDSSDATVQANARAIGLAQSYANLLDMITEIGKTTE